MEATGAWPPLSSSLPTSYLRASPIGRPPSRASPPLPPGAANAAPSPPPPPRAQAPAGLSNIPGVPTGLVVVGASEALRRVAMTPRSARPPFVHILAMVPPAGADPRPVLRYAHDVQTAFAAGSLSSPISAPRQAPLDLLISSSSLGHSGTSTNSTFGKSAPARHDFQKSSIPIDSFIQSDNLNGNQSPAQSFDEIKSIVNSSPADFVVAVGERNIRTATLHLSTPGGHLVDISLEEAILAIAREWKDILTVDQPDAKERRDEWLLGGANPNILTTQRMEKMLEDMGCLSKNVARLTSRLDWISRAVDDLRVASNDGSRKVKLRKHASSSSHGPRSRGHKKPVEHRIQELEKDLVALHQDSVEAFILVRALPAASMPGSSLPSEAVRRKLLRFINELIPHIEGTGDIMNTILTLSRDPTKNNTRSLTSSPWLLYLDSLRDVEDTQKLQRGLASKHTAGALKSKENAWACMHCGSWSEENEIGCGVCKCRRQRSGWDIIGRSTDQTLRNDQILTEILALESQQKKSQQMAAIKLSSSCGVYIPPNGETKTKHTGLSDAFPFRGKGFGGDLGLHRSVSHKTLNDAEGLSSIGGLAFQSRQTLGGSVDNLVDLSRSSKPVPSGMLPTPLAASKPLQIPNARVAARKARDSPVGTPSPSYHLSVSAPNAWGVRDMPGPVAGGGESVWTSRSPSALPSVFPGETSIESPVGAFSSLSLNDRAFDGDLVDLVGAEGATTPSADYEGRFGGRDTRGQMHVGSLPSTIGGGDAWARGMEESLASNSRSTDRSYKMF